MPQSERARARPALSITTPSLTRHLIEFFPAQDLPPQQDGVPVSISDPLSDELVHVSLRRYVKDLIDLAVSVGAIDRARGDKMLANFDTALEERSNFAINCGYFLGFRLRIVIVKYLEHFTITFVLDNDGSKYALEIACEPHVASVRELAILVARRLIAHGRSPEGTRAERVIPLSPHYKCPNPPADFETNDVYLNDIMYREIWVAFDAALGNNEAITWVGRTALKSDSRGLLLTASPSEGAAVDKTIFAEIQRSKPPIIASDISQPLTPSIRDYLQAESVFFSATLGIGTSDHFLEKDQPEMQWDPNNVLCFVNKETAIYGSRLEYRAGTGDIPFDVYNKNYDYTRYFLIYDGTNDFTLGRLVRRIHVLGELRILALIERSEITMLSECLKLLGNELSLVIDHMTGRFDGNGKKQAETLDVGILSAIVDSYNDIGKRRKFENLIHKISIPGNTSVEYKRCYGGLLYRLNRSKYYYEALNERINDLDCADINSFQSYSRYVLRNYNQQMRSINSIGERYTALGARIDRAVSIAHGLQQRKFAQYAANIAICIAGVPTFAAINGFLTFAFGGKYPLIQIATTIGVVVLIVVSVLTCINVVRELLLDAGLYVVITNSTSPDAKSSTLGKKIAGELRKYALVSKIIGAYDATRLIK